MSMDQYAQVYGKLRAGVLSHHFAINNHFRTNFLNHSLVLPAKPTNEIDWWRQGSRGCDNPLISMGMFMTCLAIEHYLGRQDVLPLLNACLDTIGSLYKFVGKGNHFDGYIIRWDPVLSDRNWGPAFPDRDGFNHSHAFYLNPDGTYNYCTPLQDPRSRRPMTLAEWQAASPEERRKSRDQYIDGWQGPFRSWEPSMDELVGLIMGYSMVHELVSRRLSADPTVGGGDVLRKIEYQANNLGDYLAEYGYYLVRPGGGFSSRGASGILLALEYPFTRAFERITGNPEGTYNIRHGFQWVMEKADVWKSLEQPFNWYSIIGYALSGLSPIFLDAATAVGASFLFGATCPFTGGQLGQIWAIYSHRHVFPVTMDYDESGYNQRDARGEFAFGYALSLLSYRRRFDDWMNGQAVIKGGFARFFAPHLGLMGFEDSIPNVRTAYLFWHSFIDRTVRSNYSQAVAMLLQADGTGEQELVDRLNANLSPDILWYENEKIEESWGESQERMISIALAWLHRKLREEKGQTVTTPNFPELPDWSDTTNSWPRAVIPGAVIDGDRSVFPLPEDEGAIQRGKTLATLTRNPDGSADLFLDNPVAARSLVPSVQLFKPSQKLLFDQTFVIPEWKGDVPTGIILNKGDEFEIEATGRIWAGDPLIGENGPNGCEDRVEYDHKFPLTGQPNGHPFCLLGKLGEDGAYFFIGEHLSRQNYLGDPSYELFLRINDYNPGGGRGAFTCRVRVWQANRIAWLYPCDYTGNLLDHLEFRSTQEGTTRPDSFFVRHNGIRNVTINSVRVEGGEGAFQLRARPPYGPPWVVRDQDWQPIELDFSPQRTGIYQATVVILSDDPLRPEFRVPVQANVTQPRAPRAIISISPTTLDFGREMVGSDNQMNLTVSNSGNGDCYASELTLVDETSPGQFFVPFSIPGPISVNQSIQITITYRPSTPGAATGWAVLRSQVASGEYVENAITLKGEGGYSGIRIEPNPLVFGAVAALSSRQMGFRIFNDGNMDLTNLDILAGPSEFTHENVALPASIAPGGFADVHVTFTAPDAPGLAITRFWDIVSNDPQNPRLRLTLCGTIVGARIEVVPESINLGRVRGDMDVTADIVNRGSAPLIVTKLKFEKGKVFKLLKSNARLPYTIAPGQRQTIGIHFTMSAKLRGQIDDALNVYSNDPRNPVLPVHLRVTI